MSFNGTADTVTASAFDTVMASGLATGGTVSIYPYNGSGQWSPQTTQWYPATWTISTPQQNCAGDIHVFPCPHCDKCKCGAATVKRKK